MIVGHAKKDLPGGQVAMSLPRILSTDQVSYEKDGYAIVIPFDTAPGRFVIEVASGKKAA